MSQTPSILSTENLTKRYGDRVVVDHLTVDIPRGAVAGFIGPNGAGKTTTMAMLLGLVRPTAGRGAVLGEPIDRPQRYLRRVGALLEGPALWPSLSAVDNLRVLARLGGHDERQIPDVLDQVGLAGRGGDKIGGYSLGMRQRLGIAAALLGRPELLILDEPANGLDPAGMSDMRELIGRLATDERTVLVSSHLLSELEQTCDWLVIIERGRLVYAGRATEFGARTGHEVLLGVPEPAELLVLTDLVAAAGFEAGRDGDNLVVPVNGDDPRRVASSLNRAAAAAGIALAEVHVRRPTLESTYLRTLEGDIR